MHLRHVIDELKIMYKNLQSLHKDFANMKLMKYPYHKGQNRTITANLKSAPPNKRPMHVIY